MVEKVDFLIQKMTNILRIVEKHMEEENSKGYCVHSISQIMREALQ